jgi:hypothetical protein
MRIQTLALVFLAAVLPAAALAQKSKATAKPESDAGAVVPVMRAPSTSDIQELNPAWLMVDKRKKLALSDSQVVQFKALEQKIRERNKALLTEYDSVRRDFHPPSGSIARAKPKSEVDVPISNDRDTERAQSQLRVLNYIIRQLADRRKQDVDETLALFTDQGQKKKAMDFIKDQDDDLARMLPRGGSPGGTD